METRYTNAIEDNVANMLLYGEIGSEVNGGYFTQEMRYHDMMGRKIKVYINSPGGSVFEGYSIAQAIMDYEADTHVVGLAASMAGVILQFGKHRTANDFAVGMIHLPSSSGKGNEKLLSIVKDNLLNILSSRSTTLKDTLEALMEEETFFDADEMLGHGLVDEVILTNVSKVSYDDKTTLTDLYSIYNKLIFDTEMKELKNHFKLSDNATEEQILDSVKTLETNIENLNEELSVANTAKDEALSQVAELSKERDELVEEIANSIVDNAAESGKIEKGKEGIWLDAAKKDPKGVKAQLDSIKVGNRLDSVSATVINRADVDEDPKDNIIEWVRNNGDKLEKMVDDDPDEYESIMNRYFEACKTVED